MADPGMLRDELDGVLEAVAGDARAYLAGIDEEPVKPAGAEAALPSVDAPLPADGSGAPDAVTELVELCRSSALRSAGPRFFHFVMGGRVFAGTTVYDGRVAFRPAIVNWRTRGEDVDALVDVLLELAYRICTSALSPTTKR